MTTIEDTQLYAYADRLKDKVVLITGAANGIGKEAAIAFAKYNAKICIGDLDEAGANSTVAEIKAAGGEAISRRTNVREYDSIAALFQLCIETYKRVDIVVPCAGVTEKGQFTTVKLDSNGVPSKPNMITTEINLISVMWTQSEAKILRFQPQIAFGAISAKPA